MQRSRETAGESSPSLRRLVKIGMKPLNVWPMLILLIAVIFIIIWLRPHS
jgi:hypothetical protein